MSLVRFAAAVISLFAATAGSADTLEPVRLVAGTSTLNIGYPNLTLPASLGYWKDEGLNVELMTSSGTLQAIQQLVGSGADFAEGNVAAYLQGISRNKLPLKVLIAHGVTDWKFVVRKGSPIKDAASLKGKKVGMISLASGGLPLLRSYLAENGIAPDSVEVIPVGFGAAPVEALRRGDVDALLYWSAAVAAFENSGLSVEAFAPQIWQQHPDYVLGTTSEIAAKNPDIAIKLSRGMMKAVLFARTNPECALELFWRDRPEGRSKGPDEATSKAWDLNILKAKVDTYSATARLADESVSGKIDARYWDKLEDHLVATKQIPAKVAAANFLAPIPDFFAKVNDFDKAAVIAQAKACKL